MERRRIGSAQPLLHPGYSFRFLSHCGQHRVPQIPNRLGQRALVCATSRVAADGITQKRKHKRPSTAAFRTRQERIPSDDTRVDAPQDDAPRISIHGEHIGTPSTRRRAEDTHTW